MITTRNSVRFSSRLLGRTAVALVLLGGLIGCGLETYNNRVEATRAYWAYLDKLDLNLSPPWKNYPVDVLRLPLQFKEIPAPVGETKPDGEVVMPDVDPRQPEIPNFTIEGLIGAFQANLDCIVNNEKVTHPAYIYVAANSEMFLTDKVEEAASFAKNFVASLEVAAQAAAKTEPPAMFPKGHQFVQKQSFDVTLINSPIQVRGVRYDFEVYSTKNADNEVVVLFMAPEGMDPMTKVSERIQLMLETMKVSSARPTPKSAGGKGGGAPAAPAANF